MRIPALYLMALWLHGDGPNDCVLPLPPAPPYLEAGKRYSVKDFCALLTEHFPDLAGQAPVEKTARKPSSRRKKASAKKTRKPRQA